MFGVVTRFLVVLLSIMILHPSTTTFVVAQLSVARSGLVGAAINNTVLFAGGDNSTQSSLSEVNIVDIYDIIMGSWKVASLSYAQSTDLQGVSTNGKLLFSGYRDASIVDIYDVGSKLWSTTSFLSLNRSYAAAALDGVVLFAGPSKYNTSLTAVDIYHTQTASWTTADPPTSASSTLLDTAAAINGKVLFAGPSGAVYIYNIATQTWSNASLSVIRGGMAAAAIGNKVMFAGGRVFVRVGRGGTYRDLNVVDIYDTVTDSWTTANLSVSRYALAAAADSGVVIFGGGAAVSDVVDFYDTATDTWHNATLSVARSSLAVAASNGKAYFAGGETTADLSAVVDVCDLRTFTCSPLPTSRPTLSPTAFAATSRQLSLFAAAVSALLVLVT